ncbi:MAG: LemA family protein [Tannerella sp.]|jgi:LemA protein|nr:LemA family protein [Tannerella sp.]
MTEFIIIGIFLFLLMLWFVFTHNRFVARNNRVKQTESSIDVMLKQRNDMIPNLVAAVRKYVGHENTTLVKISELRAGIHQSENSKEQMELGAALSKSLADIKVAVESYPELKADRQFMRLEESVEEMEYQLQAARRTYNAAVTDFNNLVQMFPSSIVAGILRYTCYEMITIPKAETVNVDVNALFNG